MPELDTHLCIACGLCARVCPTAKITYEDGAPAVHEDRRCMQCWHCAAICPQQAVREEGMQLYRPTPSGELERLVVLRRSNRHFQTTPPDRQVIAHALELAAWAPTARNERTYGWAVVNGRDRVLELMDVILTWAAETPPFQMFPQLVRGHRDPVTCEAPCALFCHDAADAAEPETNCVIAATTAELLLAKQGVGTCWGGYLRRAADACPGARAFLGLPEGHHVHAVLLAGIPDREPYCNVPFRPRPEIIWR